MNKSDIILEGNIKNKALFAASELTLSEIMDLEDSSLKLNILKEYSRVLKEYLLTPLDRFIFSENFDINTVSLRILKEALSIETKNNILMLSSENIVKLVNSQRKKPISNQSADELFECIKILRETDMTFERHEEKSETIRRLHVSNLFAPDEIIKMYHLKEDTRVFDFSYTCPICSGKVPAGKRLWRYRPLFHCSTNSNLRGRISNEFYTHEECLYYIPIEIGPFEDFYVKVQDGYNPNINANEELPSKKDGVALDFNSIRSNLIGMSAPLDVEWFDYSKENMKNRYAKRKIRKTKEEEKMFKAEIRRKKKEDAYRLELERKFGKNNS